MRALILLPAVALGLMAAGLSGCEGDSDQPHVGNQFNQVEVNDVDEPDQNTACNRGPAKKYQDGEVVYEPAC